MTRLLVEVPAAGREEVSSEREESVLDVLVLTQCRSVSGVAGRFAGTEVSLREKTEENIIKSERFLKGSERGRGKGQKTTASWTEVVLERE